MSANTGLRMWYRYLNCGFPLTATAGTDKMTTFVTVGANRLYAHVAGYLTCNASIDTLNAGRTFVSNNTLITSTVNGHEPGSRLALTSNKDRVLRIYAKAE